MELYAYYCKSCRRRTVLGRWLDNIALTAALSLAFSALLTVRLHFLPAFVCGLILAVCTVFTGAGLVDRRRRKRFAAWKTRELLKLRQRELAALPPADYLALLRSGLQRAGVEDACIIPDQGYPEAELTAADMWHLRNTARGRNAVIVTTRRISGDAAVLAAELQAPDIRLLSAYDLLQPEKLPDLKGGEEQLLKRLQEKTRKKKQQVQLVKGAKVLRYLFLAAVLFVLSFFTAFPLWYRLAGTGCCLAAVFWLFVSSTVKEPS